MRVVIIGAGPAGLTVAEHVRRLEPSAEVTMVSAEASAPYSPPAMADHFLGSDTGALFWKPVPEGVAFLAGAAVREVRIDAREVVLDDGTTLPWDRLVIASGARLYAPVEGMDMPGVYDFKSLDAARAVVDRVRREGVRRAIVVGAGFIGVEVALLLADLGVSVTVLEMADRVMPRALDAETAAIVLAGLVRRGVAVRLGTKVQAFEGQDAVEAVRISATERLAADVFVAATGVMPNVMFLRGSGVALAWGVLVDDHLRTNVPHVYACGDVAETFDRLTGARFVHANFPNAVAQGEIVARNLLGEDVAYEGAESMNSLKHLGIPVMLVGEARGEEIRWRRGDVLRKVFLDDGHIVGFRLAGDLRGGGFLRTLLLRGVDVTPWRHRLLDPTFGVADFVTA